MVVWFELDSVPRLPKFPVSAEKVGIVETSHLPLSAYAISEVNVHNYSRDMHKHSKKCQELFS